MDPVDFFNHIQSEGVNFFAGVPDSLLAPFCATVDAHVRVVGGSIPPRWESIRFRLAPRTYDAPPTMGCACGA